MDHITTEVEFDGQKRRVYLRPGTSDAPIFRDVFAGRPYDIRQLSRGPELAAYFGNMMASGKPGLVIDAGANVGAASIFFKMLFRNVRIVAIESSPENFRMLERNTVGIDRLTCMNAAVASSKGLSRIVDPKVAGGFLGLRASPVTGPLGGQEQIVPRVTIDEIYAREAATAFPFVVKIDIEGGEEDLFAQNLGWVARTPVIIIELHDWLIPRQRTSANFLRCIAGLNRDFITNGENIYSISNDLPLG